MKKVFLSLITIFMVLSLSVVLVKASETTIAIENGAQIRTDGNNGLRWQATVTNPVEGQTYGFLFAQGDLETVTVETANVINEKVTELKDDNTFAATMVKFPKAAATQDISVVAYVCTDVEDPATYKYSSVVVRNLSEVAIEAYEVKGLTEGFVKSVYDASLTTFNLNDGQLLGEFEFVLQNFNNYTGLGTGASNGVVPISQAGNRMNRTWNRIVIEYDSKLGLWYSVGVGSSTSNTDISGSENAYVIGSHSNNTDTQSKAKIDAIFNEVKEGKVYYFNLGTFNLENIPSSSNSWYQHVSADTNPELLVGTSIHLGGGEILPNASKDYYDFAGWFNNAELNGDKIVNQGKDRNLYAKYTPTKYTITYNLNGGACSTSLVKEYNIESEKITLPTAAEMSIDAGKFVGWYDNAAMNGNAVTEIASGSHGDLELYALWEMEAPTVVELSAADIAVLEKVTPTIIVNKDVKAGKYVVNEVEYSTGSTAFASIDAALSVSKENDIIYVFAGTYADELTISTANLSIIGPNYNINGTETRNNEAILNNQILITAAGLTLNGVKFGGNCALTVKANNTKLTNINSVSTTFNKNGTTNRNAVIVTSGNVSNFELSNSYFNTGSSTYLKGVFASHNTLSNALFENNYFTHNSVDNTSISDAIAIYNSAGTIEFISNTFEWITDDVCILMGSETLNADVVNVIDNKFIGRTVEGTSYYTCGLYFRTLKSGGVVNVIHNYFGYLAGTIISGRYSKENAIYNIKYNIFDETAYRQDKSNTVGSTKYDLGLGTFNYEGNYYGKELPAGYIHATDYKPSTEYTKEMLEEAYAEYLTTLE